jgi:hypothetical protein
VGELILDLEALFRRLLCFSDLAKELDFYFFGLAAYLLATLLCLMN